MKMKEVEKAVRVAFEELHRKGKFSEQKAEEVSSPSKAKREERSAVGQNSSTFSDATIKSKNLSTISKKKF